MARPSMPAQSEPATKGAVPPVQVPRLPRQPRQRRRGLLLFGAIVVAGGGVLAFHTINGMSNRTPVVVVTRDVAVGQQITANDVAATMVGADTGAVGSLPGSELQRVIGMRAAADLVKGMLVQSRLVTAQLVPAADEQLVPVALKPSRLPARGLKPGDHVLVVPVPDEQTTLSRRGAAPGVEAVVDQVKGPDTDGLVVVDLVVANVYGPSLAALAADGRVALILNPRRP
ncbi:hypothetical protein JYK22_02210, partial [Nonomuraea sp. RK-328]|nr:hypothetical protein [Nonomuraea sp. RK-328]